MGLMVQKVCLHQRLGQTSHIVSILASLFDILHDPSIVGLPTSVEDDATDLIYSKPINLFTIDDEAAVGHFTSKGSSGEQRTSLDDLATL